MAAEIFTADWAHLWADKINGNADYKKAAAKWEGAIAMIMTADGDMGIEEERIVIADVRPLPVHDHVLIGSHRLPLPTPSVRPPRRFRLLLRRHGAKELAIIQHLGPQTVVDQVAQMFDELPIDVLADGRANLAPIYSNSDHPRCRLASLHFPSLP